MEVKLTVLPPGETVDRDDLTVKHADQVTEAVLIVDATATGRPSIMFMGTSEPHEAIALEVTWQLLDMIHGACRGAFGPPTSVFGMGVRLTPEQLDELRRAVGDLQEEIDKE